MIFLRILVNYSKSFTQRSQSDKDHKGGKKEFSSEPY